VIIDDIIDAVEAAVEGTTVTTDSSGVVAAGGDNPDSTTTVTYSPGQFAGLDTGDIENCGQERNFTVDVSSLEKIDGTGTSGKTNRSVRVTVRVKYVNENRGRRAFYSMAFSDAARIQDRVEVAINAVDGVGVCYSDPGADVSWDAEEPTVAYLDVPFVVAYVDDLVTA